MAKRLAIGRDTINKEDKINEIIFFIVPPIPYINLIKLLNMAKFFQLLKKIPNFIVHFNNFFVKEVNHLSIIIVILIFLLIIRACLIYLNF